MARATSTFQQQDYGQPDTGEWRELRGELVALLDQVETQVARTARPEPGYQGLAERMRDLRHQVTEAEPDTRHREALRSVQRAIDRFSEPDAPPPAMGNPRDTLESAIQQIRSRHFPIPQAAAPAPAPMAPPALPRFDEMAEAVGGISDRLERLEGELRVQAKGQTTNVREIAEQVGQLSHVVELLAGAVGETGQVKRLEGHIAGLAKLIADGPKVDIEALNKRLDDVALTVGTLAELQKHYADRSDTSGMTARLDDVSATVGRLVDLQAQHVGRGNDIAMAARLDEITETVGRLADLQTQTAGRDDPSASAMTARLDEMSATVDRLASLQGKVADHTDIAGMTARLEDVSATVGRLADLQVRVANRVDAPQQALHDQMQSVEAGIRNIYDRVDAIERTMAMPPAELERITAELGLVAQAMKSPQQPQGLIELIDALNQRISDIEVRSEDVGNLKIDMEALRKTVALALEPRFASIEQQIGALSDKVDERPAEPSIAQLEAQVRQLVARMDQTGEQLTGLAKLYSMPAEQPAPDFDQLADLVAARTSAAIKRADGPVTATLAEAEYAEIEKRVGKVMKAAAKEKPSEETLALEATIREVNDRLKRLETSLERPAALAPAATAPVPPAPATTKPVAQAAAPVAAKPAPQPPKAQMPVDDPIGPLIEALSFEENARAVPQPVDLDDLMPDDPTADGPLVATPFGEPDPLPDPFAAAPRKRQPQAEVPAESYLTLDALESQVRPVFDPSLAERPPQPRSTLDLPADEVFVAAPVPEVSPAEPAAEPLPAPSRNTFIEAHRRAARQSAPSRSMLPAPVGVDGNSLIGRAFARFQANRAAALDTPAPAVAMPVEPVAEKSGKAMAPKVKPPKAPKTPKAAKPVAPKPSSLVEPEALEAGAEPHAETTTDTAKPSLFARFKPKAGRTLAGDKDPPRQWQPEPSPRVMPAAPQSSLLSLGAEESNPPAEEKPKQQSFLLRHKQPILLAASVVALACLTINLISQRMKADETASPLDVSDAALAPVPMAEQGFAPGIKPARMVLDNLTTASIDATTAQKFVAGGKTPAMPQAFEAAAAVAASDPTRVASLSNMVQPIPAALESPVKVDQPPAEVGPAELLAAAGNGDARAQFEVAAIYTEGRAVPEDPKAAAMWYERAAGQGFAPAQYRLGNLYENGRGVAKDLAQARLWYQQAAEAGNRMAMHNLAALYASGGLGQQQFDAAAKWFEEAADRGMKDSQFNLGMLYARGLGVKQDMAASFKWFSLAAAKGDKDAAKARDDVAGSLDAATVQKLIAEVTAFKPQQVDFASNFAPIGTWSKNFDPGEPITNPKVIKGVQRALALLGFDIGTLDGVAGGKTAEAIRNFERATGMSERGQINPRLLAVLGSQPV